MILHGKGVREVVTLVALGFWGGGGWGLGRLAIKLNLSRDEDDRLQHRLDLAMAAVW